VTLAFVGDIMLGRGVAADQTHSKDGSAVFSAIQPALSRADLRIGNLESPITTAKMVKEAYDLRAPASSVSALTSVHFNTLCFNNNHSLDAGQPGVDDTIQSTASAGITVLPPDSPSTIIQMKGLSISLFCLNDTGDSDPVSAYAHLRDFYSEKVNFNIVFIHWGSEYQSGPSSHERQLARALVNAGADVIIGSHPHVLQPVEKIEMKDRTAWVIYSLGNAVFDQEFLKSTRQSAVLLLTIHPGDSASIDFYPFVIDPDNGMTRDASDDERQTILDILFYPLPENSDDIHP
jgi:poly-gamma-glutamate synthesis protein (capsule biosynthesis protein)